MMELRLWQYDRGVPGSTAEYQCPCCGEVVAIDLSQIQQPETSWPCPECEDEARSA